MPGPVDGGSGNVPVHNGPTLREYLERLFGDHGVAHKEHAAAHEREHRFAQNAIDTAAELAKENKADANEWRSTMSDRERTFARVDAMEVLVKRIDLVEREARDRAVREIERERAQLAREAERDRGQLRVMAFIGLGATVGGFVLSLVVRLTT